MDTYSIIQVAVNVVTAGIAVYSLVSSKKNEKENRKIAEKQMQSLAFTDFSSRYQEILPHLRDDASKKWYQQNYFNLCRDEFVSYKQGNLPKEVWDGFVERMRFTVKNNPSFLTVWKGYAQIYNQDFVSFYDNEIFRKVGLL